MSLGAGYDTTYLWLKEQIGKEEMAEMQGKMFTYVEVDFDEIVLKKIHLIKHNEELHNALRESEADDKNIHEMEINLD